MSSSAKMVTVEIPATVYAELRAIADERKSDPVQEITSWVRSMRQRQVWQQGWSDLRAMVQKRPPSSIKGKSTEAILEQVRRTREEVFEAEYAHLYR